MENIYFSFAKNVKKESFANILAKLFKIWYYLTGEKL